MEIDSGRSVVAVVAVATFNEQFIRLMASYDLTMGIPCALGHCCSEKSNVHVLRVSIEILSI